MKYILVQFNCNPGNEIITDVLSANLGEIGFESFVETDKGLDAYIPSQYLSIESIDEIISNFLLDVSIEYSYSEIEDINWNEEWEKNYFQPIVIDNRCCVHSSFHKPDQEYEYEILIDPKMAFGTGHHQTTSLMMKEVLALDLKNKTLLDHGCGTAVLAILASMKGASDIIATDIDKWAYENALENVKLNNAKNIKVLHGDIFILSEEKFDVILANINRNVLLNEISKYSQLLNDGGTLIMSGFYDDDIPAIKKKAEAFGFTYKGYSEKDKWIAVSFCGKLN